MIRKYFSLTILFVLAACTSEYSPRPRGYYRFHFPEKKYQEYSNAECPFTFEFPVYSSIRRDSMFFDSTAENPCWMTVSFETLNGNIFLSYKEIDKAHSLQKLVDDCYKLAYKHTIKADEISETPIDNKHGATGLFYEIQGNVASEIQFYLTDSTRNFMRGSLYFNSAPNADSIAPAVNFVRDDMIHLVNSFRWK